MLGITKTKTRLSDSDKKSSAGEKKLFDAREREGVLKDKSR